MEGKESGESIRLTTIVEGKRYEILRLPFGISVGPHILHASINLLLERAGLGSFLNCFYADDAVLGARSIEEAEGVLDSIQRALAVGSLVIPEESIQKSWQKLSFKALGLELKGGVLCRDAAAPYPMPLSGLTRRNVVSIVNKLSDPLEVHAFDEIKGKTSRLVTPFEWDNVLPQDIQWKCFLWYSEAVRRMDMSIQAGFPPISDVEAFCMSDALSYKVVLTDKLSGAVLLRISKLLKKEHLSYAAPFKDLLGIKATCQLLIQIFGRSAESPFFVLSDSAELKLLLTHMIPEDVPQLTVIEKTLGDCLKVNMTDKKFLLELLHSFHTNFNLPSFSKIRFSRESGPLESIKISLSCALKIHQSR